MKTIAKFCLIITALATLTTGCAVRGGLVVRERPAEVVYTRPVAPYPNAIWIPGEWEWRGDHYVKVPGHWVRPTNRVWVEGHWREAPGGYVWVRGHWR